MSLQVVASIELEGILLKYKSDHFSEYVGGYWSIFFVGFVICLAYGFNSLFLRYVGVQACHIQRNYCDTWRDCCPLYESLLYL